MAERRIETVTDLSAQIRSALAGDFADVWVEGELSGFKAHPSGHWYFTLKDEGAQLKTAMFRARNSRVRFRPKDGDLVVVGGRIDLYEARGDLQLIGEQMELAGQGAMLAELERRKARFAAEGLFDPARKQAIPRMARRIGIATAEGSAALADMLRVLFGRDPGLQVFIAPCRVQGQGSAESIAAAIDLLDEHGRVDVILAGRGGGSIEDLWSWNDELVVRAIARCRTPLISCVGHETDTTLADHAADLRAPTPTKAAEIAAPDRAAEVAHLCDLEARLIGQVRRASERRRLRVQELAARLLSPRRRVERDQQRLDELRLRLVHAATAALRRRRERLLTDVISLQARHPRTELVARRERVRSLSRRLAPAIAFTLGSRRARLEGLRRALLLLGPLPTLERGYALALSERGTLLRSAAQAQAGDAVTVRLHDGDLSCRVTEVLRKP